MTTKARIRQLQGYVEAVMRLAGPASLLDEHEGEAIRVDKDHRGPPGAVIIMTRHKDGRVEHWRRNLRGWYVSKTERPQ